MIPVVITGRGLITPIGMSLSENLEALKTGRSGIKLISANVLIVSASSDRVSCGNHSEIGMSLHISDWSRKIDVTVCDCRIEDHEHLWDGCVHLVKHEQSAVLKRLEELSLLIVPHRIRETSEFVLLRNRIGEVELQSKRFSNLFAENVLA